MKTSELTGKALDWAVTMCEEPCGGYKPWVQADLDKGITHGMNYSTDWLWGGPIIERERINLWFQGNSMEWMADKPHFGKNHKAGRSYANGTTPLETAMRCYVAMKLGDEITLPKELS